MRSPGWPPVHARRGRSLRCGATPPSAGSESPAARVVLLDRGTQVILREVGPQRFREDELGVRALPQQEVGGADLAAPSYQDVGAAHLGCVAELLEIFLAPALDASGCIQVFTATPVVEGDEEDHAR